MKLTNKREKRFSYSRLIENVTNSIGIMKVKNTSTKQILLNVQTMLEEEFCKTNEIYGKHLSVKMMNTMDKFSKEMTPENILKLIEKALEYTPDLSERQQVINVFTIIEYYFNPEKFDEFKTNWKQIMQPDHRF